MITRPGLSRGILLLLGLAVGIHLAFGFILGLSVDEAHYALYAAHPDWSYFDHPPLVGWIQLVPVTYNLSDGVLRLIPETLWLIATLLCVHNTRLIAECFSSQVSTRFIIIAQSFTILCILLAPVLHVLAVGLLPDTLLLVLVPFLISLTIRLHVQISRHRSGQFLTWIMLGIVLGLSGLSKYTAIFFALAVPLCLLVWHNVRAFANVGMPVAILLAGLLISPVIIWNAQHEWISFVYQLQHGSGGTWKVSRVGVFVLNQLLSYGPLPLLGLFVVLRHRLLQSNALLLFALIPFLIFAAMSGGGGSLPHWTAPAWMALIPIAAIGLAHLWLALHRRLIKCFVTLQTLIVASGFTLLFLGGLPFVSMTDPLGKNNPIADLYGWQVAGQMAAALTDGHDTQQLVVQNWTLASRVAWYARPLAVHVLDDRRDQFDLWFGNLSPGDSAILINWSQMPYELPTQDGRFESCALLQSTTIERMHRPISQFDFYFCKDWMGSAPRQGQPR